MKLKKKKKIYAMALAMGLSLSLTGCREDVVEKSESTSLLDGTALENSVVIEVNGEKIVVQCVTMQPYTTANFHFHYCDVLTGYPYAKNNGECTDDSVEKLDDIETEPIIPHMTEEEIVKAMNQELSDEDIANIICRINQSKVKTLEGNKY